MFTDIVYFSVLIRLLRKRMKCNPKNLHLVDTLLFFPISHLSDLAIKLRNWKCIIDELKTNTDLPCNKQIKKCEE
ncbi:hypothetical protein KUTeg_007636 [Tegillarca granosa]|uniref:Uncharacterized protein n=1 Tax=Tegillarca granosa TaxID=220873 RepID=A0ABQ9FDV8_TEGGR|nr:hypothetical protein KUTeg_007636 [Tegillarca granosa]